MLWLLAGLTIAVMLVSHMGKARHVTGPVTPAAPALINGSSCDCGDHGTQTNITAARVAGACSAGTCVCDEGHVGKFCSGTEWRRGQMAQSCLEVCTEVGLACSDGDWGVASRVELSVALMAAGESPGTLCEHWSGSDWEGDPSIYALPSAAYPELNMSSQSQPQRSPFSVTCGWQTGTSTSCSTYFPGRSRICLCE